MRALQRIILGALLAGLGLAVTEEITDSGQCTYQVILSKSSKGQTVCPRCHNPSLFRCGVHVEHGSPHTPTLHFLCG